MSRWFGSVQDSDRQASERNQRAARRAIASFPVISSGSEDEFGDCETSIHLQVDGADDDIEENMAAAELARQKALPVDESNYENDPEAWKKEIKVKFDINDVEYWFNTVEAQMKKFGINEQWDKKSSIIPLLPESVVEECKPLLRLSQAEAGDTIYKDLKTEILSLYGQRDQDAFKKACALKMTGTPSSFGKQLIHIICPGSKPFVGCHCARMVYGWWEAQLTPPIKTKIAGKKFDATTYKALFVEADEAWRANGGATSTPAIVAAVTATPTEIPTTDTQQVAAISRGRGRGARGNRGGRGQTRGSQPARGGRQNNQTSNSSTTKPHQKGPKHSDLPASASWACAQHWKRGRGAPYCSDPLVCEWNQVIAPRAPSTT